MLHKRKKMRQEKRKKRGGEKTKSQSQNYLHILLSVHAQTLQADILQLNQQAAKCTTCKRLCGKF